MIDRGARRVSRTVLAADEGIFAKHGLDVNVVQSGSTAGATAVLATLGVPENKVTFLPTGTSTLRLTALVTGHVAGTLLTEPTASQAAKQGMKLILDQTTQPFAGSAITISKSFGQKNPNTVTAFIESMEVVQALQAEDPSRFKSLVLTNVYDDSFTQTINSDGFLTQLWGDQLNATAAPSSSPSPSAP